MIIEQNSTNNAIEKLAGLFAKLPGVGKKSAVRYVYHILEHDVSFAQALAHELSTLHSSIKRCGICGAYTETDPCLICSDEKRDSTLLCVVEKPKDIKIIEDSKEFHGKFHVLGALIAPLDGIGPDKLSIGALSRRIKNDCIKEIILALNPTVEGDTTALYITRVLKDIPVTVSRLSSGIPVGGDLEYADKLTLSHSFRGRVKMD
jgi:recombination protein RecR